MRCASPLVDSAAPVTGTQITTMPPAPGIGVHTVSYAPGPHRTRALEPAPAGSALVVSENYYPGWTATVDGKRAPVVRADYSLIGVVLPAGATNVELDFREPGVRARQDGHLAGARPFVACGVAAGVVVDRRRRG